MVAIGGWTKTRVGALEAPRAEAVTSTTPIPAGVQMVKSGAFQLPAHATPPGAMSRIPPVTALALEEVTEKVKVGEIWELPLFTAEAVNA